MPTRDITIINRLGLHARAATKLVQTAEQFEAEIKVTKGNKTINGKSILGVMMLAAAQNTPIQLTANGSDADAALDALEILINDKFGEGE